MLKVILFTLLPFLLFAQIKFIPVSGDYASFYGNDSLAYVEIYASIFQGSLDYQLDEAGTYKASFTSKLELSDATGVVKNLTHNYQNTFTDTLTANKYNQFVDIFSLQIPYGSYKAKLQINDNFSMKNGQYLFEFQTIEPSEELFLSDIELCSSVNRDTSQSLYSKNGLKVVPNPRRTYDLLQKMLYFYVEINNLSYDPEQTNLYEFDYAVTTSQGDTIKSRSTMKKEIAGERLVEIGALNVMALPHDAYYINVKTRDILTNTEITGRKLFQVFKPSAKKSDQDSSDVNEIITGIYGQFSKEDLMQEFAIARYLASRNEEKVFQKLENAEAMKSFLAGFWRRKDELFKTEPGEFRKIYMNRVEMANERFRTMGRDGWKTDRGRALLLYGEPDEYERFPSSMDALPYIIWHYYDLEGSQIFVFIDQDGFGDYRQIHSTYRRELQNENWQSLVKKSGGGYGY